MLVTAIRAEKLGDVLSMVLCYLSGIYFRLFENLAVLEKWYAVESRSVMEPAVLLLVSLPCTQGIELRSIVGRPCKPKMIEGKMRDLKQQFE